MTTIQGLPYYEVDFNADGSLNSATGAGSGGLPEAIAAGGISDLFVFSHGWNNGIDSARDLYAAMFGLLADQLGARAATSAATRALRHREYECNRERIIDDSADQWPDGCAQLPGKRQLVENTAHRLHGQPLTVDIEQRRS